jgi:hypothetical protein
MTWAVAHTTFLFLLVQEKEAKEGHPCTAALRVPYAYVAIRRMDLNSLALRQAVHLFRLPATTLRLQCEGGVVHNLLQQK